MTAFARTPVLTEATGSVSVLKIEWLDARVVPFIRAMFGGKYGDGMIYQVHLLKRYGTESARIVEKRTHTARSDIEAIQAVKKNFHISAPTASGFSLRRKEGMEIYRWFKPDAQSDGAYRDDVFTPSRKGRESVSRSKP